MIILYDNVTSTHSLADTTVVPAVWTGGVAASHTQCSLEFNLFSVMLVVTTWLQVPDQDFFPKGSIARVHWAGGWGGGCVEK